MANLLYSFFKVISNSKSFVHKVLICSCVDYIIINFALREDFIIIFDIYNM